MTHKNIIKTFDILSKIAISIPPVASARIASAVVYRGKIVSFGTNSIKTSPFQKRFSHHVDAIHLHAEISAIKNALRYLSTHEMSRTSLLTCRVKRESQYAKNWIWGLAKPCSGCQRAIAEFEIRNVFFTNEPNNIERL